MTATATTDPARVTAALAPPRPRERSPLAQVTAAGPHGALARDRTLP